MDHYIRLVTFAVEGCPKPLVELFVKKAEADTRPGVPLYSTIDAYIKHHQPIVQLMLKRKYIRQDQLHLILPDPTDPPVDVNKWDISLATTMLQNIFNPLPPQEQQFIDDLRSVRNELQHKSGTAELDDNDFKVKWNTLETAITKLAQCVSKGCYNDMLCYIKQLKTKPLSPPGPLLDIVLKGTKLAVDSAQGAERLITEVIVEGTKSKKGVVNKKVKVHDPVVDELKARFALTKERHQIDDYKPPNEFDEITRKFKVNRKLVIAGKGQYEAALFLINEQGFRQDRCVQVNEPDDVLHVWSEDVDLVLCVDPFGVDEYDHNKSKQMTKMFDKLLERNNAIDPDEKIDLLTLTDEFVFREYTKSHEHTLMDQFVIISNPSTATEPIQLPEYRSASTCALEPVLSNMIEHSSLYIKSLQEQNMQYRVNVISGNAKKLFLQHKSIAIIGPEHVVTSLLVASLVSSKLLGQCIVLMTPDDWKYVKLGEISILVIEDFTGQYEYDQALTTRWLKVFDLIQAAVSGRKLSVIITSKAEHWEQCKHRLVTHALLEHRIEFTDDDISKTNIKSDEASIACCSNQVRQTLPGAPIIMDEALITYVGHYQITFGLNTNIHIVGSMCAVIGGTFLMVVYSGNGTCLYHVDLSSCKLINSLLIEGLNYDSVVVCLSRHEAAFSVAGETGHLCIVTLCEKMRVTRTLGQVNTNTNAMAYMNREFYVPCDFNIINVYSVAGLMVRSIKYEFQHEEGDDIRYIDVIEDRIVLNYKKGLKCRYLLCLKLDGEMIWSFKIDGAFHKTCIFDREKRVYDINANSEIFRISASGSPDKVLLKYTNNINPIFFIDAERRVLYLTHGGVVYVYHLL